MSDENEAVRADRIEKLEGAVETLVGLLILVQHGISPLDEAIALATECARNALDIEAPEPTHD